MIVEKSFPRGGVPSKESKEANAKKDNIIFGALQTKVRKAKPAKETIDPEELLEQQQNDVIESHSAELLNYETIQDGMIIMGIVNAVDSLFVTVSLPGRMTARVSALEISESYTKAAQEFLDSMDNAKNYKPLHEIYEVGQLVYGRIMEVKSKKFARPEILMSLKPAEAHTDLLHKNIRKGFIFNGGISEIQEHGYVIESGIKGLRAFLPLNQAQDNLTLGQLVFLKVEKINIDTTASTCICKHLQSDQLKVKTLESDPNIDYILPSSIVQFQVKKHLKDGLQGTIMNEAFTAYVNEHQLEEPLMLPDDYEINNKYNARILYVMPLTKLIYLTLNLQNHGIKTEKSDTGINVLKRGDIIENAKVHHIGTGGVVLVLNNKLKGLISYKTIKANYKGNYDQDELLNKYSKKSKHKVRVLDYDLMDSLYTCSDDKKIVEEKYFSMEDLKPGDFVTALVKSLNIAVGGYNVEVGRIKGLIEKVYLLPGSKQYEPNTKIRCRVVDVNHERRKIYLTNRIEYMSKQNKQLLNLKDAKKGHKFMGTIVKSSEDYHLVKFFGNITGILYKNQLKNSILSEKTIKLEEGQTMIFRISSINGTKMTLDLVEDVYELGELCVATVTHVLETGFEVTVDQKCENDTNTDFEKCHTKGLVPIRLLSDYLDLIRAKSLINPINTKLQTIALNRNIFSVRDVAYFEKFGVKDFDAVVPGDILRAFIENVNDDVVELYVPIRGYSKFVKIHVKMLLMQAYNVANITLHPEQVIFVKVVGKEENTKTISVAAKLTSVWDKQLSSTSDLLEKYLSEVFEIQSALKKRGFAISKLNIGDKINVVFKGIESNTKNWLFEVEKSNILAITKASLMTGIEKKIPEIDTKQEAVVLWIDYSNDFIYISTKSADVKHIIKSKKLPEEFLNAQQVNAKVLLKLDQVFICSLKKGPNPLVFCPIKLHYNDFENSASADVKEGDFCKLAFIHKTQPIAVLQQTFGVWNQTSNKKRKPSSSEGEQIVQIQAKQRKVDNEIKKTSVMKTQKKIPQTIEISDEPEKKKSKPSNHEEKPENLNKLNNIKNTNDVKTKKGSMKNNKKKTENEDNIESTETAKSSTFFYEDTKPNINKPQSKPAKTLTGVNDFWSTDLSKLNANISVESSDDDDNNEQCHSEDKQKKKKRNAVEKFKQQREEEARLREIEDKYADPNHLPETVDQFDRLVLSEPNNSKNWINYMVFHLQSAEIDKARAIARRAVKSIQMRNIEDHLNIWVALLNLEIRYGSRDSFDTTLKEALIVNDPIKIYLRVLEILREAKKQQELIEIIGIVTKKFKGNQDVWKAAADAYFSIGMADKAQQMLHKSLTSLPEREHVNTIVMFANLNHRHGCNEMAHTLLDQVVTSYPKRVDVWAQYVDMLVKDKLIVSARSVLERSILQKIPMKKMRTIFKKYLEFEQKHGTEADVEKVKRLATEYIKQNANID